MCSFILFLHLFVQYAAFEQYNVFLFYFIVFLSPLTPAFFFYIPNAHPAWDGFISNSHPVQKGLLFRCYVLSRAERNFPEGSALTFCTYSLLPIRAFVHKNANRPEIDCISKCHREARCIFSRYG